MRDAPGRPARDLLVLWDVDGTLLDAGGVGTELYAVVFWQLFGRSLDVVAPMAGRTDRAIILETLLLAGVPDPRRHVDAFIAALAVEAPLVRAAIAARGRALPGAAAALAALAPGRRAAASGASGTPGAPGGPGVPGPAGDGRVHQSVLTGNIRVLAEVKLGALGLRGPLDLCIGAYGDEHEERAELVQVARRRTAAAHGRSASAAGEPGAPGFGGPATVVVGDTPLDIAAALAAGARAVGVASGSFSAASLRSAGADAVLPDLTDTRLVVETLLAALRGRVAPRHRAAPRRARPEPAGPAAPAQRFRHLRRRGAVAAGDVVPVVPQRRAAAGRGVVVAAAVVAAPFRGVRQLSVELDDQPVFLVVTVPVAAAAVGLGERNLPAGRRQAVRPLDVPVVPEFEQRMRSPGRRGDELIQLISPAELLAAAQRLPQRPLAGQPPPERGGNPPDRVIQVIGGVHEINDRLLDERVRDNAARETRIAVKVSRQVDFHARWLLDPAGSWNGHVNQPGLAVGEAIYLGGCLVAELRPFARIKHSRPQLRLAPRRPGECRIDAQVDLPPPAEFKLRVDHANGKPRVKRLPAGDHARLETRRLMQARGNFVAHVAEYGAARRQFGWAVHDHEEFVHLFDAELT